MSELKFTERAWEEYLFWQQQDKKTLKRINMLLQDISRNGYNGMGKSEPLRGELSGYWSKRIDDKNRLVFCLNDGIITIVQCRGHYEN